MKENHTHDPLEEYFRRTLDNHEITPPDALWERVEADLPSLAAPQPWWAPYRFWLLVGSMTGLLLLALLIPGSPLCRQRPTPSAPLSSTKPVYTLEHPFAQQQQQTSDHRLQARPSLPTPSEPNRAGQLSIEHETVNLQRSPSLFGQAAQKARKMPLSSVGHKTAVSSKAFSTSPVSAVVAEPDAQKAFAHKALPDAPANAPARTGADSKAVPLAAPAEGAPASALSFLPAGPAAVVSGAASVVLTLPSPSPHVRPARLLSDWNIGFYASSMYTPATEAPATSRGGGLQRLVFVSQPQPLRPVWAGGLRLQKRLSAHWGVELGALYFEQTRATSYASRFRFGDGRPIPGGGGPHPRREYAHYLNTPGGSATVDFRMEPANASDPVPQGEIIRVQATFTEHTSSLRLPMLASYSVGSGRLLGVARAGLVADVLLKSSLQLSSFTSENTRVRLETGMRPIIQWTPARDLSWGYWLSAGATYRWNRHIALSVEPTLAGRFSHRDAKGQPLPNPASFGGQVGLWYAW
ncbi:MAG: hypothetical protein RMJ33_03525 [Saprospiraceae bacterium]|nr:hypothetical protein [Saprospiraceae bacterium]MDW8228889.1 hypothetical protein [Saprospiraceae bacterium]